MPVDYSKLSTEELMAMRDRVRNNKKSIQSSSQKESSSFMSGLGAAFGKNKEYDIQADAAAKDLVTNIYNAIKSKSSGQEFIPQKTGEGGFYDFSQGVLNSALMAPIGGLSLLGRISGEMGMSGLMNPETIEGLKSGATTSAVVESIPIFGKLLRGGVDLFTRKDYTSNLIDSMTEHYNVSKENALSYLDPLMKKFGNYRLTKDQQSDILGYFTKDKKYFGPDSKNASDLFKEKPTIRNAQDFQSILGSEVRGLDQFDIANKHAIQAHNKVRKNVLESMGQRFDKISPNAKENYDKFRTNYAKDVGVYENNPALSNIVHGKTTGITPKKLDTSLSKAVEGDFSKVPSNHPVKGFQKELESKLKRSELYGEAGKIGSGLAGAAGGYNIYGPMGLAGYLAGPFISQMSGSIGKVSQSDPLQEALRKLYPVARTGIYGESIEPEVK